MNKQRQNPVLQDQMAALKKNVELLELKARRLQAMQTLNMLELEQAVHSLSTIEYEIKKVPALYMAMIPLRDNLLKEWGIDPIKYKDYFKQMEDINAEKTKKESKIEVVPSANTTEDK